MKAADILKTKKQYTGPNNPDFNPPPTPEPTSPPRLFVTLKKIHQTSASVSAVEEPKSDEPMGMDVVVCFLIVLQQNYTPTFKIIL